MPFIRWMGDEKQPESITIFPKKGTFYLSSKLRNNLINMGWIKIDIYIDNEKSLFGLGKGKTLSVEKSGYLSARSFVRWTGAKRKTKIKIKFNRDHELFIGKAQCVEKGSKCLVADKK